MSGNPIAIIGGGPAGLTAAAFLRRQKIPFTLYEAGDKIAGLATSFHDDEGFTYDFGAHFITNRLAAAVGIGASCRDVHYYGESVWLKGKTYSYPFGLLKSPRYLSSGIASQLSPTNRHRTFSSAAEWFRSHYGRTLANDIAIPLLEAWSGAAASTLAPAVGDKFQNSISKTLLLKAASHLTGRAVACGYSHLVPENPNVWHVYPTGGVGLLCHHLAQNLEDSIQLRSPVEAIWVDANQVQAIQVNGRAYPVSTVISTAPCHILAKLVKGTEVLQPLRSFRYRPMIFVNLRLVGRGLLSDTVLWTPESDFPFFRLTETTHSMPWLAPEGKTLLTVDIGCEVGDPYWQMDSDVLGEFCLDHLRPIIPDIRQRYLGCQVLKTAIAYPVFLKDYEGDRQKFEQSTGIQGLYSIGRNGKFSHMLMEDVYWDTLNTMQAILTKVETPEFVYCEA